MFSQKLVFSQLINFDTILLDSIKFFVNLIFVQFLTKSVIDNSRRYHSPEVPCHDLRILFRSSVAILSHGFSDFL